MSKFSVREQLLPQWRSIPLWARLVFGFGSLMALMLAVAALAALQFQNLALRAEQMLGQDMQRMLQVQEIRRFVDRHGGAMASLLTAPQADRSMIYPILAAENAQLDKLINDLARSSLDLQSANLLGRIAEHQKSYRTHFADIVLWLEAGEAHKAHDGFHRIGKPELEALLEDTAALYSNEQAILQQRQVAIERGVGRTQWLMALLTLVAVLLSALLAWRTTVSVSRPLALIERAARRIADGEYGTRVQIEDHDELGKVAQAMNAMAAAVGARALEIEHLAYYDRLSDLPNRDGMRQVARNLGQRRMSIILMDVARLRTVNEVLGFDTGDSLLVQIAERLRVAITGTPTSPGSVRILGRLGGDVFAVLCVDMDRADMERLMERIENGFAEPLECEGQVVDAQLVYGLADAPVDQALAFDTLLQHAELAVGDAKLSRQTWAWHVPLDPHERAGQLSLLSSLRSAAASGELQMWLQPKQCLRTRRILGMEALVRWNHPLRGLVLPAEFVPFAERTGHIGVVTHAMIGAALQKLGEWRETYPDLCIAVNVSALDLQESAFANRVAQMAASHQAPLENLRLELTESSLMEDADRSMWVLLELRKLGVQLSIDDFGTGYSSLAYLKKLPVNELKIDRSFVANADLHEDATAMLRTIIDLGHNLNMQVTAEGIERPEELDLLARLGCDQAQGFLIGRPMDPPETARYVAVLPIAD